MRVENPKFSYELFKRFFHICSTRPNSVQIEITNRCNLDCKMCPKGNYALPEKDIDLDLFNELVKKIKGVDVVLPVGWGESFFHPEFDKIIDILLDAGHRIKVTTNGMLLNNEKSIETALKIDYLTFSIDMLDNIHSSSGHNNPRAIQNIKELLHKRKLKNKKKPFIAVQSVLYKNNKEILDIIKLASDLGVDRVNLVRPYTKFNKSISSTFEDRLQIYRSAEKLGKKLKIRVDMFEYSTFKGYKRLLWKYFKSIFRINDWCPRLYGFCYITLDGMVTPCCALPRHIVGDLKKETLTQIWNGKNMKEFRKHHKQICRDCHVFKIR